MVLGRWAGPFLQKIVTAAAAGVVTKLAQQIPGIEQHLSIPVVAGILWAVIDSLVTKLPGGILRDYGAQLQTILNLHADSPILKIDGFVGPKTLDAAKNELKA